MSPMQASTLCSEAHAHLSPIQIAGLPITEIIRLYGGNAAAQNDMRKAAVSGFQDNNQNSKGPGGVPDKRYPISQYPSKQDCINGLVQNLSIDPDAAERECANQFIGGKGNYGGKWWTSAGSNPINVIIHSGSGNGIAVKNASIKNSSERINQKIRDYYSQTGKSMNASVSNTEVVTPSWIVAANIDTSHLRNATSNTNLKGAALDKHAAYMEAITEDISTTLRNRAERRDNQARLKNAKINSDSDKPAWAIVCNA
jgi:hypothetical protein